MPVWPPERLPLALLVDLDGTLADSHPLLRRRFADFLDARGVEATEDAFAELDGAPLSEIVSQLHARHGLAETKDELLLEYVAGLGRAYSGLGPAAGTRELLGLAEQTGMTLVLVTSAPRALARTFLEANGLESAFAAVVSGDDGPTKPDPWPFRAALDRAGVDAADALALDDAPNGIRAARAAGVSAIGVAAEPGRAETLREAGAMLVVAGLDGAAAALQALVSDAS